MNCCIIGTDTEVGKSHAMRLLCHGLRARGRKVWVHKPVACGDWDGNQAEDGRILLSLADPDQDPAAVCPLQFPAAASPHLAAAEAGIRTSRAEMSRNISAHKGDHDLLVEGAGGILAPLSSDGATIIDLCREQTLPCVLVTRPHLGTLNHTRLTVNEARRQDIDLLGLIINYHDAQIDRDSLAVRTVSTQLQELCDLPVLGEIPFAVSTNGALAQTLAQALITAHAALADAGSQH